MVTTWTTWPVLVAVAVPRPMGVENSVTLTCSPGANPEPVTVVVPPRATVGDDTVAVGATGVVGVVGVGTGSTHGTSAVGSTASALISL